jgi:hypothetical protein
MGLIRDRMRQSYCTVLRCPYLLLSIEAPNLRLSDDNSSLGIACDPPTGGRLYSAAIEGVSTALVNLCPYSRVTTAL